MPICSNTTRFLLLIVSIFVVSNVATAMGNEKEQAVLAKYVDSSVNMDVQKVSEHTYFVQGIAGIATENEGFISNAGFIVTDKGIIVFDSLGTPSLAKKLIQKIRTVSSLPITQLIVSHYHADHVYGLQVFKDLGAEIIAPVGYEEYMDSPSAAERLEERQFSLSPWVNENTYLVTPDKVISKSTRFEYGGVTFTLSLAGSAHSQGDMTLYVEPDKVLYSGDIIFEGRVPFLGNADTKHWLDTLTRMETDHVNALIPGHGPSAQEPQKAISLTRHYLARVREVMGQAVEEFVSFDEAYAAADWSEFEKLPAYEAAHRRNAYQVYLSIEQELLNR